MKLSFCSLTLRQFGSFRAQQTLRFADWGPGLYYLRGRNELRPRLESNGSGKTTLSNAIAWCLYGKTAKGLRTPDLQPWSGGGGSYVKLEVTCADASHTIERSAKPNTLQLDGKDASQEEIDQLIGLSLPTMTNSILFPQGKDLFLDLTPADKLQLMIDALDLERWEERAKRAARAAAALEEQLTFVHAHWESDRDQLARVQQMLTEAKAASQEWEQERQARITAREQEIRKFDQEIAAMQTRLDDATTARDKAEFTLKEERVTDKRLQRSCSDAFLALTEAKSKRGSLLEKREQLTERWDALDGKCPTCGRPMQAATLEKHRAHIQEQRRDVLQQLNAINVDVLQTAYQALQEQQELTQAAVEAAETRADKARDEINLYGQLFTGLKSRKQAVIDAVSADKDNRNPHTDLVHKLRRQCSELESSVEKGEREGVELKQRGERARFWVKGFKDVVLYVLDEVLDQVEGVCNAMLPEVGLDNWQLHFDVERETQSRSIKRGLAVTVLSPDNDKPVRWECWSGGEGQRMRIVAALALAEVLLAYAGVIPDLEILDEPTQHLSNSGTRDLCNFLADRAQQLGVHTVWVDHQVVESARFADVITIVRDKQGSRIEGEHSGVEDQGRGQAAEPVVRGSRQNDRGEFARFRPQASA